MPNIYLKLFLCVYTLHCRKKSKFKFLCFRNFFKIPSRSFYFIPFPSISFLTHSLSFHSIFFHSLPFPSISIHLFIILAFQYISALRFSCAAPPPQTTAPRGREQLQQLPVTFKHHAFTADTHSHQRPPLPRERHNARLQQLQPCFKQRARKAF